MSTFRAIVHVDDGTLHTSRPLTAPEKVADMFDSVVYDMAQPDGPHTSGVVSVELVVETSGESETPIGDSVAGTSSTPLAGPPPAVDADSEVDEQPAAEAVTR